MAKAVAYAEQMESHPLDDWRFGLWSSLTLEAVARAALAHISPVLLADTKDWHNLMHALGSPPTSKRYRPASIPMNEVLSRLQELVQGVTPELAGFCSQHIERRNAELHSGEIAFAGGTSRWLPKFYKTCGVLLESMNQDLSHLVSGSEAAREMIQTLDDATSKAVAQDIKAHRQVWANKTDEERATAIDQANNWAHRSVGHRVACPSCTCDALVQGTPAGAVTTSVVEDEIVQKQSMLPSVFQCIACDLKISGFSKLTACDLGDAFTATAKQTAAEYFDLYTEDQLHEAYAEHPGMELDFNE